MFIELEWASLENLCRRLGKIYRSLTVTFRNVLSSLWSVNTSFSYIFVILTEFCMAHCFLKNPAVSLCHQSKFWFLSRSSLEWIDYLTSRDWHHMLSQVFRFESITWSNWHEIRSELSNSFCQFRIIELFFCSRFFIETINSSSIFLVISENLLRFLSSRLLFYHFRW